MLEPEPKIIRIDLETVAQAGHEGVSGRRPCTLAHSKLNNKLKALGFIAVIIIVPFLIANYARTWWILLAGLGVIMLILAAVAFRFFVNWTAWRRLRYDNERRLACQNGSTTAAV